MDGVERVGVLTISEERNNQRPPQKADHLHHRGGDPEVGEQRRFEVAVFSRRNTAGSTGSLSAVTSANRNAI